MYVIVGANGFIGSYSIKNILQMTKENILALDKNIPAYNNNERVQWHVCDITKHSDLETINKLCQQREPVKIIYLAAYHAPDQVLSNPRLAWNINITALSDFVNTVDNVKCLFYASTEMVYGEGTLTQKFIEDDPKIPVNIYGKHKLIAETLVHGYGYNTVRFPFLIGPSLLNDKKHFYDIIVETILKQKSIDMFIDAYKTALDFNTVTQLLIMLIENYHNSMPKAINISGDEIISKYEIGLRIAQKYHCSESLIVPISINSDNKIFTEKRAGCTLLDNSLLKQILKLNEIKIQL